jgi:hypothetical protein
VTSATAQVFPSFASKIYTKTAGGWNKIASGTTIGPGLRLPADGPRASALRLNLRKTSDTPTLAEFQVFANSGN